MDYPDSTPTRRVLLVEDNADCRDTLALLLAAYGFEVRAAGDGRSGLWEVVTWQPDCVVCDIGLPGMDGWQLAEQVRGRLGCGVVLVALTGYGSREAFERSRQAGFDAHLVKPADPTELLAALGAG